MELYGGEIMKPIIPLAILLMLAIMVIPVSAETVVGTRAVTMNGPSGMLVPLGLENVMPLEQARMWYSWICIIIILPIAAFSSQRNHHMFAVFIPVIAAILVGIGWLYTPNLTQTMGLIIGGGFFGAAYYAKTQMRNTWGSGGPGSMLMNIVVFMIILSGVVGFVNSAAIWGEYGAVPNQFTNVNLEDEVTQISNQGGFIDDIYNLGTAFLSAAASSIKVFLSIMISVAAISAALLLVYPWLMDSPMVISALVTFQVVLWILYAKMAYDMFYVKSQFATEF